MADEFPAEPSVHGVDPELMSLTRDQWFIDDDDQAPAPEPAALSPWMIPLSAYVAGPLITALVTLFTDGRPPRANQGIALFAIGALGWLANYGLHQVATAPPLTGTVLHITLGVVFLLLYRFWIRGPTSIDTRGLQQTAGLIFALFVLLAVARDTDLWFWLGRA